MQKYLRNKYKSDDIFDKSIKILSKIKDYLFKNDENKFGELTEICVITLGKYEKNNYLYKNDNIQEYFDNIFELIKNNNQEICIYRER